MKRTHWLILTILAATGAAGLTGCKPAGGDADEKIVTEVAVQVGRVTKADLRGHVEAFGKVEPEPAQAGRPGGGTRLAAPVAGVVLEVPATEGKEVKGGELVVRLDDRVALAAVDKAKQAVTYAQQLVARQEKLKKVDGTSERAWEEAEQQLASGRAELKSAQAALSLVQLSSPLDGVVTRVNVRPGQAVDPNMVVAEIVDLNRLAVSAEVPATEAAALKPGQAAELFSQGTEQAAMNGRVSFVSPSVDPRSGTALVRVPLAKESGLRPGQFVRLRIVSEERAGRLAVPLESVVKNEEGETVIAVVEGDKAVQKPVKTGVRDGSLVEVEGGGLKEGDTVVTVGAYGLPKETKIKVMPVSATKVAGAPAPLRLERSIPLPTVKGGFDLMAADLPGQRLFVAAEDNHSVEVLDLGAMKPLRSMPGFDEPKWFNYRPEAKRLYVATAGDGRVTALNSETLEPVKTFQFKEKCNNLRYDAASGLLYVGVGKTFGSLGIIDTRKDEVRGEIPLANFPKQFELEGNLIYVNVPAARQVAVVDVAKNAVVAAWPLTEGKPNDPMGFDRQHRRLFVGCGSGKLVVFDVETGKSIASVDIAEDCDGVYYDAKRALIYVSCGAGVLEVIRQQDADHYQSAAKIPTASGAGTSLFVPEMDGLFLAVPQKDGQTAEIRFYRATAL